MKLISSALCACLIAVSAAAVHAVEGEIPGALPGGLPAVAPLSVVPAAGLTLPAPVLPAAALDAPAVEAPTAQAAVAEMATQVQTVLSQAPAAGAGAQEGAKIADIVAGGKDAVRSDAPVVSVEGNEAGELALAKEVEQKSAFVPKYREEFEKSIIGQPEMRDSLLIALLTDGHVLLEGVPGVGKTRAVRTLSKLVGLVSGRIQFTRDLMPVDIVGQEELDRKSGEWKVRKGPIFVNILLADEINRAKGQTQSGLLEGMEEHQVTVAGQQEPLPVPFLVLATQNPIEESGVNPLPEAQKDRFMFKLNVAKPSGETLSQVISMGLVRKDIPSQQVLTREQLIEARDVVRRVIVSKDVVNYISRIVDETDPMLSHTASVKQHVNQGVNAAQSGGASPRAGNWIAAAAQAHAFMDGRYYVIPEDVQAVAPRVLRHRLRLKFEAEGQVSPDAIVADVLRSVPSVSVKMKYDPKKGGIVSRILGK